MVQVHHKLSHVIYGSFVLLILFSSTVIGVSLYGNITLNSTYTTDLIGASGTVSFPSISYVYDFQMRRNSVTKPFYGYMTLDHYWYINNAYFYFHNKNFKIKVGRMHFVEGPGEFYHLFLSDSAGPLNGLSIYYKPNGFFNFKQDMISLNDVNPRSLYYRRFTVHLTKKFSISYEESILFMRAFDPWYAFIMLPYPAIEVFRGMNAPWNQNNINDNALAGFSTNYDLSAKSRIYGELLIDDLDMNAIFAPNKFQNPNKIAWLLGAQFSALNSQITVEYAGATAYTFEKTSMSDPNGYAYVVYPNYDKVDGNMLGYKYGENNDAFKAQIVYPTKFGNLSVSYEHVRLGKRTPLIPWHGLSHAPSGTHWLDGPVIETRNIFGIGAQINWQRLTFEPSLSYEKIQNVNLQKGVDTNNWKMSVIVVYSF